MNPDEIVRLEWQKFVDVKKLILFSKGNVLNARITSIESSAQVNRGDYSDDCNYYIASNCRLSIPNGNGFIEDNYAFELYCKVSFENDSQGMIIGIKSLAVKGNAAFIKDYIYK